jgi:hypothetical protein
MIPPLIRVRPAVDSEFEAFWKIYPRHEVKMRARKEWQKIKPGPELVRTILIRVEESLYSKQWEDKNFIPHPATWLHQRRWEDDPPPAKKRDTIGAPPKTEPMTEMKRAELIKQVEDAAKQAEERFQRMKGKHAQALAHIQMA